ncbi:MAG: saccharopine dehydrogenase L-lysine forming [Actinomycetota bacterium]|nr:saccharopine dehydrogenase L-lysine forming [Actinomycetota bacterium]
MRVLVVGAGGVGAAIAGAAADSEVLERVVVADLELGRASAAVDRCADTRFVAHALDASNAAAITELAQHERVDVVLNACDPRLNPSIFAAAFDAGCHYIDMAMTLSQPHPERPYELPGVTLGAEQFASSERFEQRGLLALVGMGVEPGLSDVFARYAADHLFAEIDQIGVRDGSDLVIEGLDFAPTFSAWTTIEECLNPPLVWEHDREWFTTLPFSEPETFVFPEGIGPIECVNEENEEVLLIPRWVTCRRVTFKYGLGDEFIEVLRVLDKTGLASTKPVRVRGVEISPRDVVAAVLPDPASLGDRMRGRTCAGTWVSGTGIGGRAREVYLYHVSDNADTMARHGAQAVVWQTAVNPVVALELLATGAWEGAGVLGPEAFDAVPFLDRLRERGEEWHVDER